MRKPVVGKDVEKEELSYIAGGSTSWHNYSGTIWRLLRTFNIKLPYPPATALIPTTYPKDTNLYKKSFL